VDTRFFLDENKLVPVFEQPPFNISYRVGNPLDAAQHAGADWIVEVRVAVAEGLTPSNDVFVSVVDPATLLRDGTREPPLPGAPLTTMRASVGGTPLLAGAHTFPAMVVTAGVNGKLQKRIGNGFSERVDIVTADLHIRIATAKAKKFNEEEMQVKALHLDVEFMRFNSSAARGVLPELWGLVPISAGTKKLLSRPSNTAPLA